MDIYYSLIHRHPYIFPLITIVIYSLLFVNASMLIYKYSISELYNYISIVPVVFAIITYGLYRGNKYMFNYQAIISSLIYYSVGLFLIYYSLNALVYQDQLLLFGFSLIIYSALLFYSDKNTLKKLLLATPLLLLFVPLPLSFVFNFSAYLTRILLSIVIPLTRLIGVNVNVQYTVAGVIVNIPYGRNILKFNIAPICSGIIGLFSVLATAPLLIYVALNSSRKASMGILGGLLGVAFLAIFMFFANVLRLVSVFYFTHLYGYRIGYGIFHYTSEIILIVPIVLLVLFIMEKIVGELKLFPEASYTRVNTLANAKHQHLLVVSTVFLIIIALVSSTPLLSTTYTSPQTIFVKTYSDPPVLFNRSTGLLYEFIPTSIGKYKVIYYGRMHQWEKQLGSTTRVHMFRAVINPTKTLDILIEFSKRPSGIHMWEICLWWQNITEYYEENIFVNGSNGEIKSLLYGIRYGSKTLNGYLIYWRDRVYTEDGLEYFRATIMINKINGNISLNDIKMVKQLGIILWHRALDASFMKYSSEKGVTLNYYLEIILPTIIVLYTAIIIYYKYSRNNAS